MSFCQTVPAHTIRRFWSAAAGKSMRAVLFCLKHGICFRQNTSQSAVADENERAYASLLHKLHVCQLSGFAKGQG